MNAFSYLIWTSARNRFLGTLRRVRSPRYAIALLVGILYLWSFLFRPIGRGGSAATSMFLGQPTEMIVTLLLGSTLVGAWLFGADSTALAFTQAEVSLLFSAPLTRRQLVKYKLFRAQIAVLFNALIWVFILKRGGTILPSPLRAVGLWVLFSTLNMHRLGAALVRTSWQEHGTQGAKRNVGSILVFGTMATLVIAGIVMGRAAFSAVHSIGPFFTALGRILAVPPASWGLFPVHLIVAPTFARSVSAWGIAILPAIGLLLFHRWWVLRTDVAFEDAAIAASAERARRIEAMRARRTIGVATPRTAKGSIALASAGRPSFAIIWKNMLCLRRTIQFRVFIAPIIAALAVGSGLADQTEWGPRGLFAANAISLAGILMLFGGRLVRNDLRQDMLHLPLIKSLPVHPREIVLVEVASSALPMATIQMVLIAIAFIISTLMPEIGIPATTRLALLIASPFAILAINGALVTIENATAVLFPAWVRLGPVVSTGVEALGQSVMASIAMFIALGLGLVLPVITGWLFVFWMHERGAVALALIIIFSSVLLAVETYGVMNLLGRALARAEPFQTA